MFCMHGVALKYSSHKFRETISLFGAVLYNSCRRQELTKYGGVDGHSIGRDLSVMLNLQLKQHVDTIVRSCFYKLCQLRSVRRSLTFNGLRTQLRAFVVSRVDYCNAVLYGVAPILRDTLHWLQFNASTQIAMMTFNCIRGTFPAYFHDVCLPVGLLVCVPWCKASLCRSWLSTQSVLSDMILGVFASLLRCPIVNGLHLERDPSVQSVRSSC